ncbi:MAG: dTMP kinase [Candidatus Woesearchaeota archaeon]|nr:dTMP kinase [Candidatus Woesearchaeota archaeon]
MQKGIFIVFDGMDGTGKSTNLYKSAEYIFEKTKQYTHLLLTREPTYSPYGQELRKMLREEKDPLKNAKMCFELFIKDRKHHVDNMIAPALKSGQIVLMDRYKYSNIAFQQTQGIDKKELIEANAKFIVPDLIIILDLDPEASLARIKNRSETEKFENLEFMKKLRHNFLNLKKDLPNENIVIIDASKSREEVFNEIKKELDKVLPY